jgi:ubiquinone biosynthesis protein UbiJ
VIAGLDALFTQERLLALLAHALTRLIATDSVAMARLRALRGRVAAVHVNGIAPTLYAAVDGDALILATATARDPDVTLSGRIVDFVEFARARRGAETVPAGRLQISGDLGTAQALQALLDDLDVDWEALLAERVGEVAAHQAGRGVRAATARLTAARTAWREDLGAWLQDEARLLPAPDEVEAFMRETMALASDVERLAARFARLRARGKPQC